MECIEARALKSSFLSQMDMKTNSQVVYNDDVWCLTGINNVSSDDFPVEELLNLDFSEKEYEEVGFVLEDKEEKIAKNRSSHGFSSNDFDSLSAGEFGVPVEDLENLEWLSQFVDDSTSEVSLLFPAGSFTGKTEPVPVQKTNHPNFPVHFPVKARTKRSRPAGKLWSLASSESYSTSSSSSSPSPSPSPSYGSSIISSFLFMKKPAVKKQKRKHETETGLVSGRRCTHCQVQKTPQWRAGPLGPKTLCNACGVRFKSGRLCPEYRPACSPTFSHDVHSNSHRKVLEMRRRKEVGPTVFEG